MTTIMFKHIQNSLLTVAVSIVIGVAGSAMASDPFGVAQRSVVKLFIEPLRITNAELVMSAEPFPAKCAAYAITIRVVQPTKGRRREVLKIDTVIIADRLHFLAASGPPLHNGDQRLSNESINRTITFLGQINGWKAIDEPPKRGTKKGYTERRMRDLHPRDYEPGVQTIVFDELTGAPILIGAPPSPTATNCGG
jgi:hypothetical protein